MNYFATINLNLLLGCTFFFLTLTTPSVQFNEISLEETQQQKNTNAKSLNLSRLEKDVVFIGNSKHFRIRTDTGVSLDDAQRTTVEIIASRGYPVEIHEVITDDGYILELHRIPHGIGQLPYIKRRPVFLQHGFLNTDNVWLITPTNQALAYILSDLGFDVWLGNARGNTYSRNHVYLDPDEEEFWNFSFDEMGRYDLPAVIRYVLDRTGYSTMSYIGHSMGCAIFFICMTYHPELNKKIDVMIALAPASSLAESETGIRFQARFVDQLLLLFKILGVHLYLPNDSFQHNFRKKFCGPSLFLRHSICKNPVFGTTGDDYRNIDLNLLPVIDGHNPAGTSVRTAAHFAQNFNAGQTFQPYDFGPSENQLLYGQPTPPPYDLSKVTCPVYIFWGEDDKVVAPGDVAWLASKLGNLQASIPVEDPLWNHQDHLLSPDAKRLVYDEFIPLLPEPFS